MTKITQLPTPPTREDPSSFDERADKFLSALPSFGNELSALSAELLKEAEKVKEIQDELYTTITDFADTKGRLENEIESVQRAKEEAQRSKEGAEYAEKSARGHRDYIEQNYKKAVANLAQNVTVLDLTGYPDKYELEERQEENSIFVFEGVTKEVRTTRRGLVTVINLTGDSFRFNEHTIAKYSTNQLLLKEPFLEFWAEYSDSFIIFGEKHRFYNYSIRRGSPRHHNKRRELDEVFGKVNILDKDTALYFDENTKTIHLFKRDGKHLTAPYGAKDLGGIEIFTPGKMTKPDGAPLTIDVIGNAAFLKSGGVCDVYFFQAGKYKKFMTLDKPIDFVISTCPFYTTSTNKIYYKDQEVLAYEPVSFSSYVEIPADEMCAILAPFSGGGEFEERDYWYKIDKDKIYKSKYKALALRAFGPYLSNPLREIGKIRIESRPGYMHFQLDNQHNEGIVGLIEPEWVQVATAPNFEAFES